MRKCKRISEELPKAGHRLHPKTLSELDRLLERAQSSCYRAAAASCSDASVKGPITLMAAPA